MPYLAEILGSKKILLTLMSRLEKHVTSLDCPFFYVVQVCKYVCKQSNEAEVIMNSFANLRARLVGARNIGLCNSGRLSSVNMRI